MTSEIRTRAEPGVGENMQRVSAATITALESFDSPTVFNALVQKYGLPNEEYTDHTIRCLLPELGTVVGYAMTSEVTTNDPDAPAIPWHEYYEYLDAVEGPLVAVMRDVDSRPGRGASFGDGMAGLHKRLGVVGAVIEGTIRDLDGIRAVGLPIFAWGRVLGHGVFNLARYDVPVTVGQLRIRPGDLVLADGDGCVRIPVVDADEILDLAGQVREMEAGIHASHRDPDFTVAQLRQRYEEAQSE
jgi:4-hydroxy-4-methyl-2-oxoglutarate aldolase